MNRVTLSGRITRDSELAYSNAAEPKAICKFNLAVNRMKKDESDFLNCVAFGKTAEIISKYTSKGSKILVNGKIQTGSYTNKEGKKVYTTDVLVDEVELLDSKQKTEEPKVTGDEGFMQVADEGLPFE